ncbi:MAG: M28 family peptidase [Candidatus Eisenbacteria bacterium]|nr:M28 family peptidase [Candidatus Eisenbacteria bacterium]
MKKSGDFVLIVMLLSSLSLNCASGGHPAFDGAKAYEHLVAQVNLGPRNPGSPGHERGREYIVKEMEKCGATVTTQVFDGVLGEGSVKLENIISSFYPEEKTRILLAAHWDTRPWADLDSPENADEPIPGANDGASGVSVLLEVGRLLGEAKPPVGVDIVFFDGEDLGQPDRPDLYSQGARFYAKSLGATAPSFGIVVDMVGDKDLSIYKEGYSVISALGLTSRIWETARNLKVQQFKNEVKYTLIDDHIPLIDAGIPTSLLIDFDYPSWHTLRDTPDKCSPQSLEAVGKVVTELVYSTKPALLKTRPRKSPGF